MTLKTLISQYMSLLPTKYWKILAPLGVLLLTHRINQRLSRRALNNATPAKFDWEEEIILVTGGAGGIGAATVKKLAERGTTVAVLDILPLTYEAPKNVHYYKCDLTNREGLATVAETLTREVGTPTCVVVSAGICRGKTILDASQRDIEVTFGVNNLGLIWTIQTFLPAMVTKNHGHILIIASQAAYLSTAGIVDYAATKAATLAIYEGIQTELRHNYKAPAVRLSCISPSAVQTNMFRGIKVPSFLPALTPGDIASVIAEIIWSGRAQNRMIPPSAGLSQPARVVPEWMRVALQDYAKDAMSSLSPHQPMQ
ncbi:hypothetical protein N7468_010173 [Penicillium chermesinum]|uniref:Uncharacterized protein n=1 Tax=Penicillium chermesinum TaxID=63820 RepID=A0A9W9NC71_9EURO|nr:uncharacterized protein N7468_010173 [Penicillium chermesinum]KAJ5217165.1 hypothetical protein N7468_010173 [Penicillium chermesinum]KAJ6171218.1 hypothetical protein N7470_000285 [Penicillium chermesinum]